MSQAKGRSGHGSGRRGGKKLVDAEEFVDLSQAEDADMNAHATPTSMAASNSHASTPLAQTGRPRARLPNNPTKAKDGWMMLSQGIMVREYKQTKRVNSLTKIAIFDSASLFSTASGSDVPVDGKDLVHYNETLAEALGMVSDYAKIVIVCTSGAGFDEGEMGQFKRAINGFLKEMKLPMVVLFGTTHTQLHQTIVHNVLSVDAELATSFFVSDKSPALAAFADRIGLKDSHITPDEILGVRSRGVVAHNAGAANKGIIDLFKELSKLSFKAQMKWPGFSYMKVYKVLASFPFPIMTGNLKEVLRLPDVGKVSVGIIQEYLTSGRVALLEDLRSMT